MREKRAPANGAKDERGDRPAYQQEKILSKKTKLPA
jgi:hypothetical protein